MSAVVRRKGRRMASWTREEALEWYARAKAKLGRGPTMEEMVPYTRTFVRLFGSLGEFQRAGGDEPRPQGRPKGGKAT